MDMTVSRAAAVAAGAGPGLGTVQPTKSPEAESETPPQIQLTKPISYSNGVLKRRAPPQVVYKECLKNHAATLGGHALDGCGEFMPSPAANSADPTSLKCAACGCHRNFHRRDPEDSLVNSHINATHVIEYQPHHRHHPLPPPPSAAANRAESPPPISSTFAPHMLLALSTGVATANDGVAPLVTNNGVPHHHNHHQPHHNIQQQQTSRKRFRTKFSQDQKDKMHEFAEKVGWKMQKTNEEMVNNFCNEIGVERGVFKVWMHNNKNTFGKRSTSTPTATATATAASGSGNNNNNGGVHDDDEEDNNGDLNGNGNNSNSSISINDQSHHHIHHHHHHHQQQQQQQQHFLNGKSNNNNASSSSS